MTSPDTVTDLLVRLREEGIAVTELSVQKPTLDEVFLTITGRPAVEESGITTRTGGQPLMSQIVKPARPARSRSRPATSGNSRTASASVRRSTTRGSWPIAGC